MYFLKNPDHCSHPFLPALPQPLFSALPLLPPPQSHPAGHLNAVEPPPGCVNGQAVDRAGGLHGFKAVKRVASHKPYHSPTVYATLYTTHYTRT